MVLKRPRERTLAVAATEGGIPALTFAEQFADYAANIVAWWEYRDDLITDSLISAVLLASKWDARLPSSGVSWDQSSDALKPRHDEGLGLFFKGDSADVMELTGASVPSGDKTVLVVHTTDSSEGGTSYLIGNVGTTNTAWALRCNTVDGGSMYAAIGPAAASRAYSFGSPIWHILSYNQDEKAVFLETMGSGVVQAIDMAERTTETAAFMGGSNNLGGNNYIGTVHAGLIWNEALYSVNSGTHAGLATKRDLLRRYGDAVVQALS